MTLTEFISTDKGITSVVLLAGAENCKSRQVGVGIRSTSPELLAVRRPNRYSDRLTSLWTGSRSTSSSRRNYRIYLIPSVLFLHSDVSGGISTCP